MRWRDDVLRKNAAYEFTLAKNAGRPPDDPPEMLAGDLQDGLLPHNILSGIAKERGKCKECVSARLMNNKMILNLLHSLGP